MASTTTIPVSSSVQKAVTTTQTATNANASASVSVSTPSALTNAVSGLLTIDAITPFKSWWSLDTTKKVLYDVTFFGVGIVLLFVGLTIVSNESGFTDKAVKGVKQASSLAALFV